MSQPRIPSVWSKYRYYLLSLATIWRGVKGWAKMGALINSQPPTITLHDGLKFKIRSVMDLWIIKETCLDRDYESFGVSIQDGWTVVDIGAGLGDFAISIGYRRPDCHILAFEPFGQSFDLLKENIVLNNLTNVKPIQAAVAAQTGTLQLAETGAAVQHTTQSTIASRSTDISRHIVPAIGLADLLQTYHLAKVDFLKIDCEGGEFDILLHTAADILLKFDHICLEYHDSATAHHHHELAAHLAEAGFEVRTQGNPVHADLGLLYARRMF